MATLKELDEKQERERKKLRRVFRRDLDAVLGVGAKLNALRSIPDEEWNRAENGE